MQIDEPYDDTKKSSDISLNLIFRLATDEDIASVVDLMHQRNPKMDKSLLLQMVSDEIKVYADGKNYAIFVAEYKAAIIGFCRYYNSESVPADKVKFVSEPGFYGAGLIVDADHRRKGVASFLSKKREEWLASIGAKGLYSCVSISNLASQRMHEKLGFEFLRKVSGVVTQSFLPNEGLLYYKRFK